MKLSILSVCLLAFLFTFSTQTFAASFVVNNNGDTNDANTADNLCLDALGNCTLRAAIQQANALAGDDTITFALATPATINLTIGELLINSNITIIGAGARNLTVQRSTEVGTTKFRIFNIFGNAGTTVAISNITIANGNIAEAGSVGGGISIAPNNTLNLTNVSLKNNSADFGGGVASGGMLNVSNSTISNNIAIQGGGIRVDGSSVTNISNSTISDNTASTVGTTQGNGGGIVVFSGQLNLTNVTVSNNVATFSAGGIFSFGTIRIRNTIVANNTASRDPDAEFASGLTNLGNNLFINPLLGALQNNGGQTDTRALLPGSPAIDAGNNCVVTATCPSNNPLFALTTDQRGTGFLRLVDGNGDGTAIVDIGAFEVQLGTTAATVSVSGRVTARGRGISNAVVHLTSQSGEILTARTNRLGYYTFSELAAGETYIFNVFSKRYQFDPKVISLTEDLSELDFTAQ
jgi:hypothetical protein